MGEVAYERFLVRNTFVGICSTYQRWQALDAEKRVKIINELERGCFNDAVVSCTRDGIDRWFSNQPFTRRYSANCYKILSNLDPRSSIHLLDELIEGKIVPVEVVSMTSYELCPAASKREHDEIELRMNQHIEEKVSLRYRCPKCNENKTVPREYTGRAADESTCFSIKCISCGYIWRK